MSATVIESDRSGPTSILRISGDITSASEADLMAAYARPSTGARPPWSSTSASSST